MSQRFRLRFATILSICLGCYARSGATARPHDRLVPAVEKTSAVIPDVRPPALAANTEAATLMQQLRERRVGNAATRLRLATLYENANFLTMGEFFRASIAVTNGTAIEWKHHNGAWACGGDAEAEFAAVNSWQKQLLRGEVAAVENDSAAAARANPASCLIQLTHAEATLIHSTMDPAAVDTLRQELAMRAWLTFSDEGNILPAGKADIVAVYITAGQTFSATGDIISALTAYRIARLRIDESAGASETSRWLDERIARLQSKSSVQE